MPDRSAAGDQLYGSDDAARGFAATGAVAGFAAAGAVAGFAATGAFAGFVGPVGFTAALAGGGLALAGITTGAVFETIVGDDVSTGGASGAGGRADKLAAAAVRFGSGVGSSGLRGRLPDCDATMITDATATSPKKTRSARFAFCFRCALLPRRLAGRRLATGASSCSRGRAFELGPSRFTAAAPAARRATRPEGAPRPGLPSSSRASAATGFDGIEGAAAPDERTRGPLGCFSLRSARESFLLTASTVPKADRAAKTDGDIALPQRWPPPVASRVRVHVSGKAAPDPKLGQLRA